MRILISLGALAVLGACASTEEPEAAVEDAALEVAEEVPQGPIAGSAEDFELAAGNRVFFGYDEHSLTADARATLGRQADWLKTYADVEILVAGNCDERGTREYNLALGARRANAARDYLVSLGVDQARIRTVSYGKERPIDNGSSGSAWSKNRNATTSLKIAN